MQVNSTNNINFQSRFVANETFKRGFDNIAHSGNCRMFARTIDAILNDGKNDIIELSSEYRKEPFFNKNLKPAIVLNINNDEINEFFYRTKTNKLDDKTIGETVETVVDYLQAMREPQISFHTYSDYEKKASKDSGTLEHLSINKMKELRSKIFGK